MHFLRSFEPVPLADVLEQIPDCKHIGTTGGKATEILLSLLPEKVKLPKTGETIPFVFNGRELTLTRFAIYITCLSVEPTEKG